MRKNRKKGQAALEYLTTYAWVLMIITIGLGTLAYFGFLSPSKFVPDRCWFGSQLVCEDYHFSRLNPTQSLLRVQVRNNFARDIRIVDIVSIDDRYAINNCNVIAVPIDIGVRQIGEIICTLDTAIFQGDKHSVPLLISLRRNESGVPVPPIHNITGEVFTILN